MEVLPRDGASVNGFSFPDECMCPHTCSLHMLIHVVSYKHVTKDTQRGFWILSLKPCLILHLDSLFGKIIFIFKRQ